MSQLMADTPIFYYVLGIRGREYIVTIYEDGASQWDDLSRGCLSDRIQGAEGEGSVVAIRISDEIFVKARRLAEREKEEELRMGQPQVPAGEFAADISQMDCLLADFFWLRVNPLTPDPLTQTEPPSPIG